MIVAVITISLFVLYSIILLYLWRSWRRIPEVEELEPVSIKLSVIIPARNEEEHIGKLLKALELQDYPRQNFEVILVDDSSEDSTAAIAGRFANVRLIRMEEEGRNSNKKSAITEGVHAATGEYIVTTDADCIPGPRWLSTIAGFISRNESVFVAAPVLIDAGDQLVQKFQAMDFMMLQGITGAVVNDRRLAMCNGANLAYRRSVFFEVGGFKEIDEIASGDDMLLMQKIRSRYPTKVHYLKSQHAIVSTAAVKTWSAFFSQRIRWASKARHYDDRNMIFILVLVYLVNLSFPTMLLLGFMNPLFWLLCLGLLIAKTLVELPLFNSTAKFFRRENWSVQFPFFQPLHILYTLLAGFFGQVGKYEWKGRKVK